MLSFENRAELTMATNNSTADKITMADAFHVRSASEASKNRKVKYVLTAPVAVAKSPKAKRLTAIIFSQVGNWSLTIHGCCGLATCHNTRCDMFLSMETEETGTRTQMKHSNIFEPQASGQRPSIFARLKCERLGNRAMRYNSTYYGQQHKEEVSCRVDDTSGKQVLLLVKAALWCGRYRPICFWWTGVVYQYTMREQDQRYYIPALEHSEKEEDGAVQADKPGNGYHNISVRVATDGYHSPYESQYGQFRQACRQIKQQL